jgi:hypothetical protein
MTLDGSGIAEKVYWTVTMALALLRTPPPPLPLLECMLELAVAVTGRSIVPVPMNCVNTEPALEAVRLREYVCSVIVGGMKFGSVFGSIDDHVPLDSVNFTKSTGCRVPGAPKICETPSEP